MPYWLPETRTLLWWALAIGLTWFVIAQPSKAATDVHHFFHFLDWAARQLGKFAGSL